MSVVFAFDAFNAMHLLHLKFENLSKPEDINLLWIVFSMSFLEKLCWNFKTIYGD